MLSSNELLDLALHSDFLSYAKQGVSLNNVSFRKPTHIYQSDACEFSSGSYNIISGRAWRWEIPVHLQLCTSINTPEFLAFMLMIWIDITLDLVHLKDCILSQTDNSTAAGWLCKSNFADNHDETAQLSIVHKLATLIIDT